MSASTTSDSDAQNVLWGMEAYIPFLRHHQTNSLPYFQRIIQTLIPGLIVYASYGINFPGHSGSNGNNGGIGI